MRTASGLALIAIGAILAFAVTAQPSFLSLHVTGWVLMLTGLVGMFLPTRSYGWLQRRVVWRHGPGGRVIDKVEESQGPSYLMLNSAASGWASDSADAQDSAPEESSSAQRG